MLSRIHGMLTAPPGRNRKSGCGIGLPLFLGPLLTVTSMAVAETPVEQSDVAKSIDRLASSISFAGDARMRYENTSGIDGTPDRNRGVMRARLKTTYQFNPHVTLGARLTTGDADDPNSTDVTMSNFADDLSLSLDQAYVEWRYQNMFLSGGKFANPLAKTDLVWDGDVNPYGVVGSLQLLTTTALSLGVTGIFTVIDEQTSLDDSHMAGAQISLSSGLVDDWVVSFDSAYYDYSIGSLLNANSGDTRDNNLTADGSAYVSDFELLDTIIGLQFSGLGERWPLRLSADYVRNLGANVAEDSGYGLDLSFGRASAVGDWKVSYGYANNETDAVFTAFSHDNTTYASNYRQHTLALDYVPMSDITLNLTSYYYRRDQFMPGYSDDWDDYITRIRLNLSFSF